MKSGNLNFLEPSRPLQACNGTALPLTNVCALYADCSVAIKFTFRNVVAHGDAREGKWRGNWRMECVPSTLTRPLNVVYPALLTLMRTPRLPAVDWTGSPPDLNGLVRLGERRNLVPARVPSGSARALHSIKTKCRRLSNVRLTTDLMTKVQASLLCTLPNYFTVPEIRHTL